MISAGLREFLIESFETELDMRIHQVSHLVESPIEMDFLMAFIMSNPSVIVVEDDQQVPDDGMIIVPQCEFSKYRVDFVICLLEGGRMVRKLAIECDGHDFHERTKEQAERDRSRDRYLMSKGIPVYRFTGREIHRNAVKCAAEAYDQLMVNKGKVA